MCCTYTLLNYNYFLNYKSNMAKVIVERLSNEEAIKMYGKSMSFVGGNANEDLKKLGQGNKKKQSNDNKNSATKKG